MEAIQKKKYPWNFSKNTCRTKYYTRQYFFFWNNQRYLDLFKYLTILLDMYSPPIPHITGYYKEESIKDGSNVLARGFKLRISWIS